MVRKRGGKLAERKNDPKKRSGRSSSGKETDTKKRSGSGQSGKTARKTSSGKSQSSASSPKQPRRKRRKKTETPLSSAVKVIAGLVLCAAAALAVCIQKNIITTDDILRFLGLDGFGGNTVIHNAESTDFDFAVYYLDVGQGDSELIIAGDTAVLIDAGEAEYGQRVLSAIKALNVKKLDYIIATHPHSDHIGGLATVINGIDVEKIIAPKVPENMIPTSSVYENFLIAVNDNNKKLKPARAGDVYSLGAGAQMEIIAPIGNDYSDLNDYSVVCRVTYGDTSFMFTGDASNPSEKDMIGSGMELFSDVLKVGHHGSRYSSSEDFLLKTAPSLCIISCGAGNTYGHPNEEAVRRIEKITGNIYRTDICGNIAVFSDGEKLYVKTDKQE